MTDLRQSALAAALVLTGVVAGRYSSAPALTVSADAGVDARMGKTTGYTGGNQPGLLQVVPYKSGEVAAFVYEPGTQRLMFYVTEDRHLRVTAVRDVEYDARLPEYHNNNDPGMSVKELKVAFSEAEKKKEEAEKDPKKKNP